MTTGALLCSSAMTTTMYARGARRGSSTALRWCLTRTANNNQGQPCAPTRQHGRVATLGTTHGFSTARRVETTRAVSDNAAGTSPEQQQRQPNNGKQLAQTPPHTQRSAVPVQNRMPHKSTTNSGVSAQPQQHGPTPQSNAQWQQREQQRQQPPRGGGGNTNNGYNNNGGAGAAAAGFQRQNNNGVGYAQAGGRSMLPQEIDALYHQMQHLGSKWADLHAEAELLEESKKCVLASITLHYMNDGDSKSSGESKVRSGLWGGGLREGERERGVWGGREGSAVLRGVPAAIF